jgi:hypothetical protein
MQIENFVLSTSVSVDQSYPTHVEYSSGLLLFRTCLYEFAFAESAVELVQKITSNLQPQTSASAEWRLDEVTFKAWQKSAKVLLALLHEIRMKTFATEDAVKNSLNEVLSLSQFASFINRNTVRDSSNRIAFV